MTIRNVITWDDSHRELRDDLGHVARVDADAPVTVVSEPQPEEPTEFGARVVVDGRKFLRSPSWEDDSLPWREENECTWFDWSDLCEMGPVTVIPDQGWEVPDTPEVPDRIEEWPEDDTSLRKHKWRDVYGDVWVYVDGAWRWGIHPYGDYETPIGDPWTRVTDA